MRNLIFKNLLKKFPYFSNRKGKPFTRCAAKRRSDKASLILAQSKVTGPSVIELQISVPCRGQIARSPNNYFASWPSHHPQNKMGIVN